MEPTSFIVLYDFPCGTKNSLSQFYRRLAELLCDFGGKAMCRATKSAYIVSGEQAMQCAYAIGQLAAHYGAGGVGAENGVIVLPLGDVEPRVHFAELKRAEGMVAALCVDRRRRENKKAPRSLAAVGGVEKNDEGAWVDVRTFRRARVEA